MGKHTNIDKEKKGRYRGTGFLTLDRHPAETVALARRGFKNQLGSKSKQKHIEREEELERERG